MKQQYIKPISECITTDALCSDIVSASVHEGSTSGNVIDNFGVYDQNSGEGQADKPDFGNWGDD